MIIIYNLSGLLVGAAGILAGVVALAVSGWLSLALFLIGGIWLYFGRSKRDPATGLARPSPSLFFIPLYILAIPVLLLAVLAIFVDTQQSRAPRDPRQARFREDEKALGQSKLTGDRDVALAAYNALKPVALDDDMHVFAAVNDPRVLVLARIPSLKELNDADRAGMVKALATAFETLDATRGRQLFLGIKGRFAYGVVQTPTVQKFGKIVPSEPLLSYYDFPGPPAESASENLE